MSQKEDKYPEVIALKAFCIEKNCATRKLDDSYTLHSFFTPILLLIDSVEIVIQVQDEYNDIAINNSLLNIVLCLQELELIEDSTDYLNWLQFQSIKKSTETLRSYYQKMVDVIPDLRPKFAHKTITSFIPGIDYQLNSNSMYYLRKNLIR
ncbi:hypothetical protein [Aquimarina sp. 2201CG5-10]|uniref:hypothetical protein n=1 Tax=Aquimarina callyspongiae TaxID=3098150 RepID=UPI002AB4127D|nr:hypothetical protein [Aquimarina sp. 2201CG5-10]MDY8136064.1 hypothetical protein [Aquimarina sp. 2201CG5-10]